jgi:hypothetical protein
LLWRSGTLTLAKTIRGQLTSVIGDGAGERNARSNPARNAEKITSTTPTGKLG